MKKEAEIVIEERHGAEHDSLEQLLGGAGQAEAESKDAVKQENQEWKDRYLRQAAELENYKKRSEREKADFLRRANEALVKDLLPVLDNLDRALTNPGEVDEESPFYQGVKMIGVDIGKILGKYGLEGFEALDKPFDPNCQEAIAQQVDNSVSENTVVGQMQKGYFFQGRMLRPALVMVSKKG